MIPVDLLQLRLLVGALGERAAPPWWRTQFMSEVGLRMGARLFPRTVMRAALESVTLAARREHDAHLGPRLFHLFRLPVAIESSLFDLLEKPDFTSGLTAPPADLPALLRTLGSSSTGAGTLASGPQRLGPVSRLTDPEIVGEVAAAYARAAASGLRVYPYFDAEGPR